VVEVSRAGSGRLPVMRVAAGAGRLDLDLREVEALREESRAAGARALPGEARDGRGARRQEDARHEHDAMSLRSGAYAVNPNARASWRYLPPRSGGASVVGPPQRGRVREQGSGRNTGCVPAAYVLRARTRGPSQAVSSTDAGVRAGEGARRANVQREADPITALPISAGRTAKSTARARDSGAPARQSGNRRARFLS
jgi:hypothetical protein